MTHQKEQIEQNTIQDASGSKSKAVTSNSVYPVNKNPIRDGTYDKEIIGKGLHGMVYLLRDQHDRTLKCVEKLVTWKEDPLKKEAFLSEVKLLQDVSHPNIVSLLGYHQGSTYGLMFLNHVAGRDIWALMDKSGILSEHLTCLIISDVLKGLKYLHEKSIVHADIKAENVMWDAESKTAVLLDFSLSFQYHRWNDVKFGTLFAMAPEILAGKNQIDWHIDIWAIGVLAYEMICGKPPFWSENDHDTIRGILKEAPLLPRNMSDPAASFLRQCLQKDPARRPSARELLTHRWFGTKT